MSGIKPGPETFLPTSPRARGRRRRAWIALAVVAIVVAAAISTYELYPAPHPASSTHPAPPSGWVTFDTAWSDISDAFGAFANGPWTIVFAEGVAADGPWAPPASFWAESPEDSPALWQACSSQLSGTSTLTFWNASAYPYSGSPDVYSSGAAPLWTFIFNGTATSTFMASWVAGHIVVNAVLGSASPCLRLGVFQGLSYDRVNPSKEVNSDVIAAGAAAVNPLGLPPGVLPTPTPPSPAFAAYFPGPQFVPITTNNARTWTVVYGDCGMAGELGANFTLSVYNFNATTARGGLAAWSLTPCYDSYYDIAMDPARIPAPPSPFGVYREWMLNVSFLSSAVPPKWSASNLTTSLLHWQLRASAPPWPLLPSSVANCSSVNPGLANCTPPTGGWYAVLLNPNGSWLDSYPTVANGTTWSIPGVPVSSGDRILFVGAIGTPTNATFQLPYWGEPAVLGGIILTPS